MPETKGFLWHLMTGRPSRERSIPACPSEAPMPGSIPTACGMRRRWPLTAGSSPSAPRRRGSGRLRKDQEPSPEHSTTGSSLPTSGSGSWTRIPTKRLCRASSTRSPTRGRTGGAGTRNTRTMNPSGRS